MLVKTKGIILKETPYSETSKVLNVITSDYGLIGILSKGCRNMKSKLRGISNKMVYAEFTIKYKETGLSTLIEGNYINPFKNIFNDIKKANYSFYLMDLIYQVLIENNDKKLFSLLEQSLIKINEGLSPELISNIVELQLLKYLGVNLNLFNCSCGNNNIFNLDINSGGVICKNCYKEGYIFNNKTIRLLKLMETIDFSKIKNLEITDENIFNEVNDFLHEYYNTYTGIYLRDKKKMNGLFFENML